MLKSQMQQVALWTSRSLLRLLRQLPLRNPTTTTTCIWTWWLQVQHRSSAHSKPLPLLLEQALGGQCEPSRPFVLTHTFFSGMPAQPAKEMWHC